MTATPVHELLGLPADAPHYKLALTHPSYANERGHTQHNQRLEFLGDAVLGFCTSELLYARYPQADEGLLTRTRAQLVNAEALAAWARHCGVAHEMRLGKGALGAGLGESTNVLADAVEALIAAAFLDGGLARARSVCERVVEFGLARHERAGARDPKSDLQERVQAAGGRPPKYHVVDSGGPAHERWFEVDVLLDGSAIGRGRGRSKRQAERAAAAAALERGSYQRPVEPPVEPEPASEPGEEAS
jgi:ribonuclease-3